MPSSPGKEERVISNGYKEVPLPPYMSGQVLAGWGTLMGQAGVMGQVGGLITVGRGADIIGM